MRITPCESWPIRLASTRWCDAIWAWSAGRPAAESIAAPKVSIVVCGIIGTSLLLDILCQAGLNEDRAYCTTEGRKRRAQVESVCDYQPRPIKVVREELFLSFEIDLNFEVILDS